MHSRKAGRAPKGHERSLSQAFKRCRRPRCRHHVLVECGALKAAKLELAQKTGRELLLLGRSLNQVVRAAKRVAISVISHSMYHPASLAISPLEKVLIICSGSQGSWNSTLVQLARDRKRDVYLESGDRVLFSARRIPGREQDITDLQEHVERPWHAEVVDSNDDAIHVSGHPCQDEIRHMPRWYSPAS